MKKILVLLIVCLVSAYSLGCNEGKNPASGPTKSYDLVGNQVSFVIPPDPWTENVQTVGEENAELGLPADRVVAVTFRHPEKDGLMAVGTVDQGLTEDGQLLELENDQATLDRIAMWVVKRDGEILNGPDKKGEYIKVLGVNAFHMVFELGEPDDRKKGEQVHFTKDGKHYTLSMLVPKKDYDKEAGHFRNLLSSFSLKKSE